MKNNKNEKTLGILAHLQKNIPPSKQQAPVDQAEAEMEFPEGEEDEELNLLKKKPAKKLMSPPSSY